MPVRRPAAPSRRALGALHAVLGALAVAACGRDAPVGPGTCTVVVTAPLEVIVGATVHATGDVKCERGTAPVVWATTDAAIATVDSTGVVTGRTPGVVSIIASVAGQPATAKSVGVRVVPPPPPPLSIFTTPRDLRLAPRGTFRLGIAVFESETTPPNTSHALDFRVADSCVARVSADGVVTGGNIGQTRLAVVSRAIPSITDTINIVVAVPSGLRIALRSLTTGSPATAVDTTQPVRGTVTAAVSVGSELLPNGGRLEVRLAGRVVGALLLPPATPDAGAIVVSYTIDTAARDAAGARLYPNGTQPLELALLGASESIFPGCPPLDLGQRLTVALKLDNP